MTFTHSEWVDPTFHERKYATLFGFLLIALVVFFESLFSHKSFCNQLTASLPVQLRPVAALPARAETLKRAAFIHFLECAVYPPEAERFHHCIHIADNTFHQTIPAFHPHPHLGAGCMVLLKPSPEFHTGRNLYDVFRFHRHIIRKTRPCVTTKVSGYVITVRKTKAEDTGRPSLQTYRRSLLMTSAIWSVFSPPLRFART